MSISKTTLDVLVAARALIAKRENWCRFARNDNGAYCALGAIDMAAYGGPVLGPDDNNIIAPLADAARAMGFHYDESNCGINDGNAWLIANFNNSKSHPEVLAMFDRAIAAEKRRLGIVDDKISAQVRSLMDSASRPRQLVDA
jgi:hypothetical protein